MKKFNKILMFVTMASLTITLFTSIPLIKNYFKGSEMKFPIFTDLHVWFGAVFAIAIITRIVINRRTIKAMILK